MQYRKVVCLVGRVGENPPGMEYQLYKTMEIFLEKGYNTFLVLGYGDFKVACMEMFFKLKHAYANYEMQMVKLGADNIYGYDDRSFPDCFSIEHMTYPKVTGNPHKWMIDTADCVAYLCDENRNDPANDYLGYARVMRKPVVRIKSLFWE